MQPCVSGKRHHLSAAQVSRHRRFRGRGRQLKIDLSKLFGAPDGSASAAEVAARERDEQLVLAGRETVGMTVGIPKRQVGSPVPSKDELDDLIDELDQLDL